MGSYVKGTVVGSFAARFAALLSLALLAAPVAPASAVISSTPDSTVQTNNTVNRILQSGTRTFIGGSFTRAGLPTPFGADFRASDASVNVSFPKPNGSVSAVVSDGAGGWYVGGTFTALGTVTRNRLAHLLASGSVDPGFNPNLNGAVTALVRSGSTLYVGGAFATVGAAPRSNVAAIDTTTGLATAFNPNVGGPVNALALAGSTLYAGGSFATVSSGVTRNNLAAFDTATATVTAFDPDIERAASDTLNTQNFGVRALALDGTRLYAAGNFSRVNGLPGTVRSRIAAFDTAGTGAVDTSFDAGIGGLDNNTDSGVNALAVAADHTLYAAGIFSTVNTNVARSQVAAFDATGLVTAFNPSVVGGTVVAGVGGTRALAVVGTTLYAGGDFTTVNGGTSRNRMAAFDTTTGTATGFDPNVDNTVLALAVAGTDVYAGGAFTFVGSSSVHNGLAAINADGTIDPNFTPSIGPAGGSSVAALAVSGSTLFVGGQFSTVDGSGRTGLAAVSTTTGAVTNFNAQVGGSVNAMLLSGTSLFIGGNFSQAGGTAVQSNLAKLDTTVPAGTADPSFTDAQPDGPVNALVLAGATLYVGGSFDLAGGAFVNNLVAMDTTFGDADATFIPSVDDGPVNALALSGSTLYAGGAFTSINGGTARNRLAAFDTTGDGTETTFNPRMGGTVNALAIAGGKLYAGGNFQTVNSPVVTRKFLADFTIPSTGAVEATFNPVMSTTVNALATSPDATTLYAGGAFLTAGAANTTQLHFARFSTPPPLPVVATGAATAITTAAASLAGTVNPGGASTSYTFEYGTTTAFGSVTTPAAAGSGTAAVPVSATLTGLASATQHFYRLDATNAAGTTFGTTLSFTTATPTPNLVFSSSPPSPALYGGTYVVSTSGGTTDPVTFSIAGASSGVCSVAGSTVSFTGVGTCTINADQPASGQHASQAITVLPAPLTITAVSNSMTYGGGVPVIAATFSGFVNADTSAVLTTPPTCVTSATSHSAAGSVQSASCSGAVAQNYAIAYVAGTVTVAKAPLTITASNASLTYGNPLPAVTASYSGFVAGDTAASLTAAPTCTADIASRTTTCSAAIDDNYAITYVAGVLTVVPAHLRIVAPSASVVFGDAIPSSFTPTYAGLVNGDTAPATPGTCTTTATAGDPAGTYAITCAGASDPNYVITATVGVLTITKRKLTITAAPVTITFGDPSPNVTPIYSGFAAGQTASVLATAPTCTAGATDGLNAGTYAKHDKCSGAVSPDFTFTYVAAGLTVAKAHLTVTAPSATIQFGATIPTFAPTYTGLVGGATSPATPATCTTVATSSTAPTTKPINCKGAADRNYTVTAVAGVLTIVKAATTLTAQALSSTSLHPSAILTRADDGTGIAAASISFAVQGAKICTAVTDAAGVATCTGVTLALPPFTATYAGSAKYFPATAATT